MPAQCYFPPLFLLPIRMPVSSVYDSESDDENFSGRVRSASGGALTSHSTSPVGITQEAVRKSPASDGEASEIYETALTESRTDTSKVQLV